MYKLGLKKLRTAVEIIRYENEQEIKKKINKAIDFYEFTLSNKIFEKFVEYTKTKKEEEKIFRKRIYLKYLKIKGFKSWLTILD